MYFNCLKLYNFIMDFVGIEKLSLLDFDEKVSCILFCEHCNFRCPFCHNSSLVYGIHNQVIPFSEIIAYLNKRKHILDAVVISGGEPTLMDDLKDKIKTIKNMGFLLKLDTNGTKPNVIKELVEEKLIDYVAMDIKNCLEKYPLTCGVKQTPNEEILKSIDYLKSNAIDYEFRTTLIKDFHDEAAIVKMGEMIKGAKKLFLQKFIAHDECINPNLEPVDIEQANKYRQILLNYVENVELRGY